ncbi:MAG: helix-turn-helix domain-containing protein [Phycisphaerales bacterium]|nr:helix-turn-helix domain-containing protein [Phycisphaerales bacterium]
MSTKSQHNVAYRKLQPFLKKMREDAGLSQQALGRKLRRPQNWVFRSETGGRRVDVTEFTAWAVACGVDPIKAYQEIL